MSLGERCPFCESYNVKFTMKYKEQYYFKCLDCGERWMEE